jgi:hypothetical protein
MEWRWALIVYLIVGILLAEGLMYHDRKAKKQTSLGHYLIALLLGPSVGLLIIIVRAVMRKEPK